MDFADLRSWPRREDKPVGDVASIFASWEIIHVMKMCG